MAPRRSPRIRPSGSSSGSSVPAPGSGSRSSSLSSPQTAEFPADSDSGSDFEASLHPRNKRGPPRGANRSLVQKRSRVSSGSGTDSEQNSLFEAVFSGKAAMETVVDEWLERYRRQREAAFLELLNCTVRACGCRGVVTPEMFRELQNSEIIQRLTETFQEASPEYPLSRRSQPWRRFRAGFSELLAGIVLRGRHRELLDGFLMDAWLSFLTGLSDSQVRAFRHTGTMAALKLMSALVAVAVAVGQQQENSGRQLEAEKGKAPARRGTERLESLRERCRELREQQEELELLMNGIFKGVFVHRYRDVVPEIRRMCMEELGLWIRTFPGSFLTDGHLKYLGWTLHDKHGEVRLQCVKALQGIYGIPEMAPNLELFTERFKPRLVAMAHDKEPEVALQVLRLLTELDRNLEEALSAEDCRSLFPVVFVSSRALASAAGEFLFHRLLDPQKRGNGAGDNRSFLVLLVDFFLDSQLHEHAAYLVDSLWDCAGSRLRDWDTATALLLQPTPTLQFRQEQALLEILSCSGLRAALGRPPPGRSAAGKVSGRELREERARLSRSLIPALPQLLEKFSAEPAPVAALLELLPHLELGMFRTERWDKCLEQVLERIQELFGKHSEPFPVLSAASGALRALSEPQLPLHGLGALARSRLGDALGQRCQLQVSQLLQAAAPDEEDVYGLAATLRRLSALFRDHDLTPWGLFEPCWRLLRRATDTGEVPAQVTIPAISCLFFHLLWELSRIPESGAPPAQLRGFRSRAASFCSRCRSCLGEPQPGLRQAAFLALCDLLVLLGPGQPREPLRLQPEPELPAQLGAALMDLVFRSQAEAGNGNSGNSGNNGNEASEGRLEELHQRRLLLAAFCKLLLQGVLELRAASDVFKHYSKFHGDYGDVIRETLRAARELDRLEWARTVLLSLRQLFTELLLQEGPDIRGLPEFQEIRDLGRRFSLFFSLQRLRNRRALLQLHSEGIQFSLQPLPEPPFSGGPPLNLPFLEVLSEFSPRLLRPERRALLALLERMCRERGLGPDFGSDLGDFGLPLLSYRRSLSAPESPPGPPQPKRARSVAPSSSSPWPPSPNLTSTLLRGGPKIRGPSPHLLSSESRRSWGSRLSLMEEEEEEEEEGTETPKTPETPLEQPRDLFGSSSLEFQTF